MKKLISILVLPALSACTPTEVSDKIALEIPSHWSHAQNLSATDSTHDLKNWWQGFHDPVLNDLVAQALKANYDLKIAIARVRQANAMVVVAESILYPSLDFSLMGGREKRISQIIPTPSANGISLNIPTVDAFTTGLSARWEIDVFGANQLAARATATQAQGAEEEFRAVQVGLLAQLATTYLELRGLQKQTVIFNKNINLQQQRLKLLKAFYKAGLSTEMDVTQQQAVLHATEANLTLLTQANETLINRLSVLLGQPPSYLATRLKQPQSTITALPKLPKLMPAELLLQRPDLRLAQTQVTAAAASLGKAKADLLPKFIFSISGGFGSLALNGFPALAETVYTLGSGLSAPIFNAGRIRAYISAADARLDEVATAYEKAFLTALEDVENAYIAYSSASTRNKHYAQAVDEAERALTQTNAFYQRGFVNYLVVLDAQKQQLALVQELIKTETAQSVSMVSLYRAMGGDWTLQIPKN